MLTLLEHSPRYALQMLKQNPEVFTGKPKPVAGDISNTAASPPALYTMIGRARREGLIRDAVNYKPPRAIVTDQMLKSRGTIRWLELTEKGRALLFDWRDAISPVQKPLSERRKAVSAAVPRKPVRGRKHNAA